MIIVDKADCVVKIGEEVDNFIKDLIKNDNFFKTFPLEIAESVKRQLKPLVEEIYVPHAQVFV